MSLVFHWCLPTCDDGRHLVGGGHGHDPAATGGDRPATLSHLGRIARSAEQLGFTGAVVPTGAWCEDAWLTAAVLARETERLELLVAVRPGLLSPTLAAQMAATFQRHSAGRLLLDVVTGGEDEEQRAHGDFLGEEERYERTDEFLSVVRALWRGREVTFAGRHLRVERASLARLPDPVPPLHLGGSSAAAGRVAARHADVHLARGEPPERVAEEVARLRREARAAGRALRFGVRLHVITRDTAAQAEAERLLAAQEVSPNRWAGVGLVRGGARTALVGSHEEVADRIAEYAALGIEEFVLSGVPHPEEVHWFGEGVLPRLARRGLLGPRPREFPAGAPSAAPVRVPAAQ